MDGWRETALAHLASVDVQVEGLTGDTDGTGAVCQVTLPTGTRHEYEVIWRERLPAAAAATLSSAGGPLLVVAAYVSDAAGDVLRSRGLHFADAAGNAYLRWPEAVVDVRGRRLPRTASVPDDRPLRAFSPRGLRVTFSLLCDPSSVSGSYRAIAERSRASLGTVQAVLEELQGKGHVVVEGRHRTLHGTRGLFDRWVEAYVVRAGPRHPLGRFDSSDPVWWGHADGELREDGALWGGETAAHFADGFLRPAVATVYSDNLPPAHDHRPSPAQGGGCRGRDRARAVLELAARGTEPSTGPRPAGLRRPHRDVRPPLPRGGGPTPEQ